VRIEFLEKVEGAGLALTHARVHLVATEPDGKTRTVHGRGTVVSRRQPDGNWRIVLDNPMSPA
jgi:ketosteroid isomerase-like protein